jgi:hypothetical protein
MARFTEVGIEARNRLARRTRGYDARAPFREALTNLTAGQQLEVMPDEGESLRSLKLNLARAAKEVNRNAHYGETQEGSLIVWLEDKPRQKRGPRKSRQSGGE